MTKMWDFPRLRPVNVNPVTVGGDRYVVLVDPLGLTPRPLDLSWEKYFYLARHFDGKTSPSEIINRLERETGVRVESAVLDQLLERLEKSLLLDDAGFRLFQSEYARQPSRASILAGRSYSEDPGKLRQELDAYFLHPDGAGSPQPEFDDPTRTVTVTTDARSDGKNAPTATAGRLRGVLAPHIDFPRGGHAYSHTYRKIIENSDADIFVILGVSHRYPCKHRFAVTRKNFETPLGAVMTDQPFIDIMESHFGSRMFEDEVAHIPEWSIELQAVFLQHGLGHRRPFRIVPILVGSFFDCVENKRDPFHTEEARAFVEALKAAEAQCGAKVMYLGSVDFGHIGREFGDAELLSDQTLAKLRDFDHTLLKHAVAGNARDWFAAAAAVDNRWRICGLDATYTMLQAMGPVTGNVLRYSQAVNPQRTCCVSFASVAFTEANAND